MDIFELSILSCTTFSIDERIWWVSMKNLDSSETIIFHCTILSARCSKLVQKFCKHKITLSQCSTSKHKTGFSTFAKGFELRDWFFTSNDSPISRIWDALSQLKGVRSNYWHYFFWFDKDLIDNFKGNYSQTDNSLFYPGLRSAVCFCLLNLLILIMMFLSFLTTVLTSSNLHFIEERGTTK